MAAQPHIVPMSICTACSQGSHVKCTSERCGCLDSACQARNRNRTAALPQLKNPPFEGSVFDRAVRLNLGCSDSHLKGYVNVDVCEPADEIVRLDQRWPWPDSSVDDVKAWDIFEHLPDKLLTMNECHRVLKPGALLDLFVPTTDGRGAFQDPTHRSFWTPNDLFYFCDQYVEWQRFRISYGISAHFKQISAEHKEYPNKVWKLRAILEAVKS